MAQFHMHYLIYAEGGPIQQGTGPELPAEVAEQLARPTLGTGKTLQIACDPTLQLGHVHRGTGSFHAVLCPRCKATEAWKEAARTQVDLSKPRDPNEPEFET